MKLCLVKIRWRVSLNKIVKVNQTNDTFWRAIIFIYNKQYLFGEQSYVYNEQYINCCIVVAFKCYYGKMNKICQKWKLFSNLSDWMTSRINLLDNARVYDTTFKNENNESKEITFLTNLLSYGEQVEVSWQKERMCLE